MKNKESQYLAAGRWHVELDERMRERIYERISAQPFRESEQKEGSSRKMTEKGGVDKRIKSKERKQKGGAEGGKRPRGRKFCG